MVGGVEKGLRVMSYSLPGERLPIRRRERVRVPRTIDNIAQPLCRCGFRVVKKLVFSWWPHRHKPKFWVFYRHFVGLLGNVVHVLYRGKAEAYFTLKALSCSEPSPRRGSFPRFVSGSTDSSGGYL